MWAFTFPGQGSQAVGMGKELADAYPEARAVFEEVDDALGKSLSTVIFEGPEDELRLTENAQPALMAVSIAAMRVLEKLGVSLEKDSAFVAGHSLGEYSALCAAGTFSLSDTAHLLQTRGRAMQSAVPVGEGSMAALLGLDLEAAQSVADNAAQGAVCEIANDNAPGQVVVSGSAAAVERAIELAKAAGARRALPLPVSAPFHCRLMAPAAEAMEEALNQVQMNPPVIPLVANVTARPVTDPDEIRRRLVEQVTGRVRWTETIFWLAEEGGVMNIAEIGAGKVLSGLAKRVGPAVVTANAGTPEEAEALAAEFK